MCKIPRLFREHFELLTKGITWAGFFGYGVPAMSFGGIFFYFKNLPIEVIIMGFVYVSSFIIYVILTRREKRKELENLNKKSQYEVKKYWDIENSFEMILARVRGNLHEMKVLCNGKLKHIEHPSGDHWSNRCKKCEENSN